VVFRKAKSDIDYKGVAVGREKIMKEMPSVTSEA
jgi:hypothetical protein